MSQDQRRKVLIAAELLVAALALMPLACGAQHSNRVPRIGFLQAYPSTNDSRFEAFRQKLRELGYVERKTVAIEYLSAEGKYDQLPRLAAELIRRNVDVLVADGGTQSTLAAMKATRTIPIVFCCVSNPVSQGFVPSLARPGGNVTGVTNQNSEFTPKSLELLKEMLPSAKRIAVLSNPANSSLPLVLGELQTAARALRLEITVVNTRGPDEFERAFAEIARERPAAVLMLQDAMLTSEATRIIDLAARHRLPVAGGTNAVADRGALMSYGPNLLDLVRRAAILVDKILKGAKPGDLPVEQPLKFDLVVNAKAAKALGITVPKELLIRADRVIE